MAPPNEQVPLRRGDEVRAQQGALELRGGLRLCLQPAAQQPGHRLQLLFAGAETYPAMLAAIASATRWIDVETYIWEDDATGRRFAAALAERARAGVQIRCLIDGAGSFGTGEQLFHELRAAGGRTSVFHPVGPWRSRWGWTARDHRKLMVVDGRLAFTGGINLGDEYAPRDWGGKGWHDLHLQITGPVVGTLQRHFEAAWRYATEDRRLLAPPRPASAPRQLPPPGAPALAASALLPPPHAASAPAHEGGWAQALTVGRRRDRTFIQRHYRYAVSMARERVYISCAYFIPNRRWRQTLREAARRGVDVRIVVPRANDIPPVHHASRYTYQSLLDAGVRIFEYLPTMMHAKALVVDGTWSAVGSYNLDQLSLRYNWEVAVAAVDTGLGARLEERFLEDLEACREIDPVRWPKRALIYKLLERFWHFFRMIL